MKAKDHRANLLLNRTTASGQHQPVDVPNSGSNIRLETIRPLPEAAPSADGSSTADLTRNELGQPRSSSLWRPSSMGILIPLLVVLNSSKKKSPIKF